jgi:hypothetical protein
MARKKKRRRRKKSKQVSGLTILGFASNIFKTAYAGSSMYQDIQAGDMQKFVYNAREVFLGIDANGKFQLSWFIDTWSRPLIGFIASKIADKVGLNRQMKRLPFIGKYLKL